ncbi:MAG: MFS transporter [Promethearchaeota archaeon]
MRRKFTLQFKDEYSLNSLWIGLFVDILGFYIVIPFLPTFIEVFNTTPFVIGLVLATNAVFTLFFALIWGYLSDKVGRKPILIISQAGTFSAFILLAFSNSVPMLFLARTIDGIFGGNFPMVKAIISDKVPPKERGLQMTNIGVCHVLAGLVGPGVGGFLSVLRLWGPEYPVFTVGMGSAGLSLITIFITIFFVEESWPRERRIKFMKEEKVNLKLRTNEDAMYLLTQYSFHTFSFTIYVSTLTIYLGIVLNLDVIGISILLTISGISRAIVRFTLFKPTLRLMGEKKMTRMGLLIVFITFFLVGFVHNIYGFVVLMLLMSYGISCSRGLLISKITQTVSPKEMGKINGYTTTLDSLAQIFGPIIGSFILTVSKPYWWGVLMGVLALIAFLMVFKKITPYHAKVELKEEELAFPP